MCWGHQGSLTFCSFLLTELALLPPVTRGEPRCGHLAQHPVGWPRQWDARDRNVSHKSPAFFLFSQRVLTPECGPWVSLPEVKGLPLIPVSRREEGRRGDTVPPSPGHTYM